MQYCTSGMRSLGVCVLILLVPGLIFFHLRSALLSRHLGNHEHAYATEASPSPLAVAVAQVPLQVSDALSTGGRNQTVTSNQITDALVAAVNPVVQTIAGNNPSLQNQQHEEEIKAADGAVAIVGEREWAGAINDWVWPLPVSHRLNCGHKMVRSCVPSSSQAKKKKALLVLLWNRIFGLPLFPHGRAMAKFQCCDGVVWTYTEDRRLLAEADIVEFHLNRRDWERMGPLPSLRPRQLVAVFSAEANPLTPSMRLMAMDQGVNLLRTYRLDAQLWHGYAKVGGCYLDEARRALAVPFEERLDVPVVALVRNCHSYSGREHILGGLMERLPIHSYGACMHNRRLLPGEPSERMFVPYKFLFSIENRLCRHYVTEKWDRNFRLATIPIVASYRDQYPVYVEQAPAPGSYVNAFDYRTIGELAYHVGRVADDRAMFYGYHSYRGANGTVSQRFRDLYGPSDDLGGWCALAKKIQDPDQLARLKQTRLKLSDINDCVQEPGILETIPY